MNFKKIKIGDANEQNKGANQDVMGLREATIFSLESLL